MFDKSPTLAKIARMGRPAWVYTSHESQVTSHDFSSLF